MEKKLADALLDFYQKILKPEFDAVHQKLAEHDERFSEVSGHLDSIYNRLGNVEDEQLALGHRMTRLEEKMTHLEGRMSDLEERMPDLEES